MRPRPLLPAAAAALVLPVCLLWELPPAEAYIHAVSDRNTSMQFSDLPAVFGYPLPRQGLAGLLAEAKLADACLPLQPPPSNTSVFIALVRRYNCSFDVKVFHAQLAGYLAVIVHNVGSDDLLNMVGEDDHLRRHITVPSVFTGETAAAYLRSLFTYERGGHVVLVPESVFPLGYYLIPFTGVVGVVIAVMCTILIIRCVQHRKRIRKDRLSKEQLKKIPLHKYKKGDEYDVCAICLEEYEDGDRLRILPCSHAYHCKCVDPWLTRTKKTCPVCKQRAVRSPEDSDSSSEGGGGDGGSPRVEGGPLDLGHQEEEEEEDSERTPLLRPLPTTAPGFGSVARSAPSSPPGGLPEEGAPPSPRSQSQLLA